MERIHRQTAVNFYKSVTKSQNPLR